jgi:NADPH2:quinone reductase
MKAVGLQEFGPPDVLQVMELPDPVPIPGRVVVRVVAATVNPTDTLLREGQQAASMTDLKPPYVPGMELAGRVHAIDGPSSLAVGQAVMGVVSPRRPEGGAQAELVSVPEVSLMPVPSHMGFAEAATIPMNGLTALLSIRALGLPAPSTVLVTGGAGALGGYVIQLARHAGHTVVADAKLADRPLLKELGAQIVVPRGPFMEREVRKMLPDGVDGLVDAARMGKAARAVVKDGHMCVSVRALSGDEEARVQHHAVSVGRYAEDAEAIRSLSELAANAVLIPRVARRLPMSQAPEAHRLVEQGGLRGRVVMIFGEGRNHA